MNFKPFTSVRIDERAQSGKFVPVGTPWTLEIDLYQLAEQQELHWKTVVAIERGITASNNMFRYVDLVIATPGELGAEVMAEYAPGSDVQYTWCEKICEAAIKQGLELCDTRVLLAFVLQHWPGVVPQYRRRGGYAPVMKTTEWEGGPRIIEISVDDEKNRFELYLSGRFLTSRSNHGHWKMDEQLIFVKPRVDGFD